MHALLPLLAAAIVLSLPRAASAQQPAPLPPLGGERFKTDRSTPTPQIDLGNPVSNFILGKIVDSFGPEQPWQWLERGKDGLYRTMYRTYFIENGYILLPVDPGGKHGPLYFLPLNPKDDPLVIFIRDADRFQDGGRGMLMAIRAAIERGDKDLVKLAGDAMFDARYTEKFWSYSLATREFGEGAFFYKIRTRGRGRLDLEGGVGQAVQLGHSKNFLGGALSVDSDGGLYRISHLSEDAQGRAKLGYWGAVPGTEGMSWGLSAAEGFKAAFGGKHPGQFSSTEFRAGLFYDGGQTQLGAFLYRVYYGNKILDPSIQADGLQLFVQPPGEFAGFFLSAERTDFPRGAGAGGSSRRTCENKFTLAVDVMLKGQGNELRDSTELFGSEPEGSAFLTKPGLTPETLVAALRRRLLEKGPEAGGDVKLLEVARAGEWWIFDHAPRDEREFPSWALSEVGAKQLEPELQAGTLIAASHLRRRTDVRVTEALFFLGALDKKRALQLDKLVASAADFVKKEFELEGEKLSRRLTAYGKNMLRELESAPQWTSKLSVVIDDRDWPALLSGYGETFIASLFGPALLKAQRGKEDVRLRVVYVPMSSQFTLMRLAGTGGVELQLGAPKPEADGTELKRRILVELRRAFP